MGVDSEEELLDHMNLNSLLKGLARCRGFLSVVRPLGPAAYVKTTSSQPNNRSHWGH